MEKYQTGGFTGIESSLSPWAGPYVTEMLGRGQALASMPYQAYEGALTAGASPLQQQAFGGLGSLTLPAASAAGSFTGAGYQPLTPEQLAAGEMPTTTAPTSPVQQYMSPYIQAALEPQYEQARRQTDIAQQALQSQYAKAGAYGGARQGIAEAELQRGLLDRLADITGTGYQQAFQQAADMFGREQDYGLRALEAQRAGGTQQRDIEQAGVLADIAQFEQERDFPYRQTQYMQSLLQGLPISTQAYQYTQPTGLQSFAGGAGSVLDLLERFGLIG
jgi:hypothetical protein